MRNILASKSGESPLPYWKIRAESKIFDQRGCIINAFKILAVKFNRASSVERFFYKSKLFTCKDVRK
jgi:hypothetical protein